MAHKSTYPAMHKYVGPDLRALLAERDQQAAHLRQQINAHIQRNTLLETRLLSTLDTLDDVRATSTEEMHILERENARLVRKCEAYERAARDSEKEKADLQGAVLQLVAKVESCNDYSKWRASRVQLSRSVSVSTKSNAVAGPSNQHQGQPECTCPNAYTPTIVEELSSSLEREHFAHAATIEEAERRITTLESRIALREAELTRLHASCHCQASSGPSKRRHAPSIIRDSEQRELASLISEKNRRLRAEVRTLAAELQRESNLQKEEQRTTYFISKSVQTEPESSSPAGPEPLSHPITPSTNKTGSPPRASSSRKPFDEDGHDRGRSASSIMAPGLQTLTDQLSLLRMRLDDVQSERDDLLSVIKREFPESWRKASVVSSSVQAEEPAPMNDLRDAPQDGDEPRGSQDALSTTAQPAEDRDLFIFSPPNRDSLNSTFPPLVPSPLRDTRSASSMPPSLSDSSQPTLSDPSNPTPETSMPPVPQTPVASAPSSLPGTPRAGGTSTLFGLSFDFASPSHPADELASPLLSFAQMHLGPDTAAVGSPTPSPVRSRPFSRLQRGTGSPRPGVFSAPPSLASTEHQNSEPRLGPAFGTPPGSTTPRLDAIERVLAEERTAEEQHQRDIDELRGNIEVIHGRLAGFRERKSDEGD